MKINGISGADNTVISMNSREQVEDKNGAQQETEGKVKNGTVKGSELNLVQDPIAEKKKKAMEDAMKFIQDQFKSEQMIDDVLAECRDTVNKSKENAKEASMELQDIEKRKEELGEMYSDKDDPEYKMRLSELNEEASHWKKQYQDSHDIIKAATEGIKSIKQEVLKHHGMIDAQKAAEKSLKASGDEIIGMLKQEAIDKIDEDLEEIVEEAKERKEEAAEQDAQLEEIRLEREKKAKEIEEALDKEKQRTQNGKPHPEPIDVAEMLERQKEIENNTQKILEEQKLLEEDIKGIVVDSLL